MKLKLRKSVKAKIKHYFYTVSTTSVITLFAIMISLNTTEANQYEEIEQTQRSNNMIITEEVVEEPVVEETKEVEVIETKKTSKKEAEAPKEEVKEVSTTVGGSSSKVSYRLTSYYSGEAGTGSCTGTGLCEKDFQINEKGWYTYKGKLVLAGATPYLLKYGYTKKEGRHYFKYYDEVKLTIDGVEYEGIILDSCGASMKVSENRIDLFVSGKSSVIDRGYKGNNMITVEY